MITIMIMSLAGTSSQSTKNHARSYPFDKLIKSLYFR